MVLQRWRVTKRCVKDSVSKMVWVKVLCEREHVTKLCAKNGVSKMVGERWCVKDGV